MLELMFSDFLDDDGVDIEREELLDNFKNRDDFHDTDNEVLAHIVNEDDFVINRHDPELKNKSKFYDNIEDDPDILAVAAIGGVIGGIAEEDVEKASEARYVSMSQAIAESKKPKTLLRKNVNKRVKTRFEVWVDDVLSGKKSYTDEL